MRGKSNVITKLSSSWLQDNVATHARHVFRNNACVLGQ